MHNSNAGSGRLRRTRPMANCPFRSLTQDQQEELKYLGENYMLCNSVPLVLPQGPGQDDAQQPPAKNQADLIKPSARGSDLSQRENQNSGKLFDQFFQQSKLQGK